MGIRVWGRGVEGGETGEGISERVFVASRSHTISQVFKNLYAHILL